MTQPSLHRWTKEELARLEAMWRDGRTASAIVGMLGIAGITRSAVLGRVHRLKLPKRLRPEAESVLARPRNPRGPADTRSRKLLGTKAKKPRGKVAGGRSSALIARIRRAPEPPPKPVRPSNAWEPLPGTSPVALVELGSRQCHWPVGEDRPFRFCGAPAAGIYCAAHQARSGRAQG